MDQNWEPEPEPSSRTVSFRLTFSEFLASVRLLRWSRRSFLFALWPLYVLIIAAALRRSDGPYSPGAWPAVVIAVVGSILWERLVSWRRARKAFRAGSIHDREVVATWSPEGYAVRLVEGLGWATWSDFRERRENRRVVILVGPLGPQILPKRVLDSASLASLRVCMAEVPLCSLVPAELRLLLTILTATGVLFTLIVFAMAMLTRSDLPLCRSKQALEAAERAANASPWFLEEKLKTSSIHVLREKDTSAAQRSCQAIIQTTTGIRFRITYGIQMQNRQTVVQVAFPP